MKHIYFAFLVLCVDIRKQINYFQNTVTYPAFSGHKETAVSIIVQTS